MRKKLLALGYDIDELRCGSDESLVNFKCICGVKEKAYFLGVGNCCLPKDLASWFVSIGGFNGAILRKHGHSEAEINTITKNIQNLAEE